MGEGRWERGTEIACYVDDQVEGLRLEGYARTALDRCSSVGRTRKDGRARHWGVGALPHIRPDHLVQQNQYREQMGEISYSTISSRSIPQLRACQLRAPATRSSAYAPKSLKMFIIVAD